MRLVIREALLSFRRQPVLSALAVTTIAFALFVLGLFGLAAVNLRAALEQAEQRVEVVMYLTRGTPVEVATVAIGGRSIENMKYIPISARALTATAGMKRSRHKTLTIAECAISVWISKISDRFVCGSNLSNYYFASY